MGADNVTIYAHWVQNPVSDWVVSTDVPSGAEIVERKWVYKRTQTKESTNASESGWVQTGSYWKQTGTGSVEYATIPSGFDKGHSLYSRFNHSAYTAYENASTKREVQNTRVGYVYWHWMYNVAYANVTNRMIADKKGVPDKNKPSSNSYNYAYFYAIASTVDCPQLSRGYVAGYYASSSPITYNCSGILPKSTSTTDGMGTPRFMRFDYYKSTYTDYQKMYKYSKTTTEESSTEVTAGGEISDVVEYVKYRAK